MSTSITSAFIAQYIAQVHEAYQQQTSMLRNSCRLQTGVIGSTAIFQKVGKGSAGKKTRHGNVPLMNADHSTVTATLEDWYAADYIDKLDELKLNSDEGRTVTNAGAYALNRKIDELLITVLDSGAGTTDTAATLGLTKSRILTALATLNAAYVPAMDRFGLVGPHQWNELLNLKEFASSDWVGDQYPWLKGTESKVWQGVTWIMHPALPLASNVRKCFIYQKQAIGLAEGQGLKVYTDWVPEKASTLVDHMISAGAVAIDGTGIYEIDCDELEAYAT